MTPSDVRPLGLANSIRTHERGFALTLTLILIALTAIVVVAFLTTTSTERATAAAYGRVERARQMAEAGADAAIAKVCTEMKFRPYHAIGYRSVPNGLDTEIVPVITGPRTTTPATAQTYNTAPVATDDVYLVSGTGANAGGIPGTVAPSGFTAANSVDLNANHQASEPKGWIGSPTSAATPIPFRASWIDVLADPALAPQPDSSQPKYNPVIGRYAYWIEDETSKLDASLVGNQDGGGGFRRGDGVDLPSATPSPKVAVNDLDIGALPLVNSSPLPSGDIVTNQALLNFRLAMPMLDARFLNRVGGQMTSDVAETTKFYSTVFSLSNDLAGNGRRRANINSLVTSPTKDPVTIAANLDDIAYVITGKHPMVPGQLGPTGGTRIFGAAPDNYLNAMTTFGTRFFTSSVPSADQQNMYIERIAANIRDYIDDDGQPTYIDTSDQVVAGVKPTLAWKSGTEPRAVGKEAIPYLQEVAWTSYQRKMDAAGNFDVDIDFYFEFVNPTTKDFVAPAGAFLKVYNRASWSKGRFGMLQPPDQEFSIAGMKFPAGSATVLTSVPTSAEYVPGLVLGTSVIPLTGATRNFTGVTDEKIGSKIGLQMFGRDGGSNPKTFDYQTEAVWGTNDGVYEALGYVAGGGNTTHPWNMDGNPTEMAPNRTRFVYSYGIRGNDDKSRSGDARSLSEQLQMISGTTLGNDQTRFYSDIAGDGNLPSPGGIPQKTTIGLAANKFVTYTTWPDPAPTPAETAATAYAIVRDGQMQSIGELGHIYDPVRTIASSAGAGNPAPTISQARGGGRTLKIGQIDDVITGGRFSPSWFNATWRLTDVFEARPVSNPPQLSERIAPSTSRGKININGVLRDDGVAFRAALRSFVFTGTPNSDPQTNGKALSAGEIDNLVASVKSYLADPAKGPMMERGELSQISFFNSGTVAGASLATSNDRAREEIFRRTIEMVTTRSASFTVYTVGEAIRQDKNGNKVTVGQKRVAVTFQLEPQNSGSSLNSNTVPYAEADKYSVKRIYAPN